MHRSGSTRKSLVILFVILLPTLLSSVSAFADDEIETIRRRLYDTYLAAGAPNEYRGKYTEILNSQNTNGSWNIRYSANTTAPFDHVRRLHAMVIAFRTPQSSHYNDPRMLAGIKKGLEFWFTTRPVSSDWPKSNWWHNQIGQQQNLMPVLVLLSRELNVRFGGQNRTLLSAGAAYLHEEIPPTHTNKRHEGQNYLWFTEQQLVRGVLLKSDEAIRKAVELIEGEISQKLVMREPFSDRVLQWPTRKGIQADYSYHLHGPQLYNGGYGMGILAHSRFALAIQGTRFAYSPETIETMAQYVLQGSGMMIRRKMIDPGSLGRGIARPGNITIGEQVGKLALEVAKLSPRRAAALTELYEHTKNRGKPYSFLGHKRFHNSDFAVHQRESYYTSVKMVSPRTNGTESLDGENLLGYWLPFGSNFISRDGNEYASLPPVWDWNHLPGVTAPHIIPKFAGEVTQADNFVGGVSDGKYGVSGMRIETLPEAGVHLQAQKAWFFFDKEYVALGSGITSRDSVLVDTTVNQTLLRGDTLINGNKPAYGSREYVNPRWVYHDNVGYVFPRAARATVRTGAHTGSWSEINSQEPRENRKTNVFTLWLSHGRKPQNATYEYIVVPGIDADDLADYVNEIPVRILVNSTSVQAVQHPGLRITQAVFYKPGKINLGDGTMLSVDQPAFVLVKAHGLAVYDVTISSPVVYQVKVTLTTEFGESILPYNLKDGVKTGSNYLKQYNVDVARGFFKVASSPRVYQSDGAGRICWFLENSHLQMNGGGDIAINTLASAPRAVGFAEAQNCSLSAGFFNLGGRAIYRSFGNGTYCQFANRENYLRAGGAHDLSNVFSHTALPAHMRNVGVCN